MRGKLAEPMVATLVHLPAWQRRILALIKKHGGGSHSKIVRQALDVELETWIFPLKDCCGVDVEKELAKGGNTAKGDA